MNPIPPSEVKCCKECWKGHVSGRGESGSHGRQVQTYFSCINHSCPCHKESPVSQCCEKCYRQCAAFEDVNKTYDCPCHHPKESPVSQCCDGECNHDDCCGKIPENCTHKESPVSQSSLTSHGQQEYLRGRSEAVGNIGAKLLARQSPQAVLDAYFDVANEELENETNS